MASRSSNDPVKAKLPLNSDPTGEVELQLGAPVRRNIKLKGFQYGEKFGHSICAVDINGDGYDDLVVGAPFHSSEDQVKSCKGLKV